MRVRARSASGFSLIELLLIVAVLAVAAAFSLPALRGTVTTYQLRTSTDTIVGELDAARVMAISRGTDYQVKLDSHSVRVEDPQDPSHPPRVRKTLDDGITVVFKQTITFRPRGSCSGGFLLLRNENHNWATVMVSGTGKTDVVLFRGYGPGEY